MKVRAVLARGAFFSFQRIWTDLSGFERDFSVMEAVPIHPVEDGGHKIAILAGLPHSGRQRAHGHTARPIRRAGWHLDDTPEVAVVDIIVQLRMDEMASQVNVPLINSVLAALCGCGGGSVVCYRLQQQVDLRNAEFRRPLQTRGAASARRHRRVAGRRREDPPEGLRRRRLPAEGGRRWRRRRRFHPLQLQLPLSAWRHHAQELNSRAQIPELRNVCECVHCLSISHWLHVDTLLSPISSLVNSNSNKITNKRTQQITQTNSLSNQLQT